MPGDDHQHNGRFISYLGHQLGYGLAICRHCNYVAEANLVMEDNFTSIDLMGSRVPTGQEDDAIGSIR